MRLQYIIGIDMTGKDAGFQFPSDSFRNLNELLHQRASQTPDKMFLFSEADGRRFSYVQFENAVNRLASMLASQGVKKGSVVSLLLPNSVEYIIAYFACWKLGALAGPVTLC